MKHRYEGVLTALVLSTAILSLPGQEIIERGMHHRVVRSVVEGPGGLATNVYTELENGLHAWDSDTGQWVDADARLTVVEGVAVGTGCSYKVSIQGNLQNLGCVELITPEPEALHLRSHVLGLLYTDADSGESVVVGSVKECEAFLVEPNQVYFLDAFDTPFVADVRYTYDKGSFHQDVVIRERMPSPADWGLNPETVRLEVVSEFLEAPEPVVGQNILKEESDPLLRESMFEPDLIDQVLQFGNMTMALGKAFWVDGTEEPVFVGKSWEVLADGRRVLVERVDYSDIAPHLQNLPAPQAARLKAPKGEVALARSFPPRRAPAAGTDPVRAVQLAKAEPAGPGFTIDYETLASASDFTFKGGRTYFVGPTTYSMTGTTVLEGNSVIKFTNSAGSRILVLGPIDCQSSQFNPIIITSKDDDTVGAQISTSTGTNVGYYAGRALDLYYTGSTFDLHDLRVRHAEKSIVLSGGSSLNLSHSQIGFGNWGVQGFGPVTDLKLENVLFHQIGTNESGTCLYKLDTVAEQITFHNLHSLRVLGSLNLTNSLIISVTTNIEWTGSYVETNSDDTGIFDTVGGGAHYLTNGAYIDAGTTGIDPGLLAELAQRTTQPPVEITEDFSGGGTTFLEPVVERDLNTPDLGYHFDPIDHVVHEITVTNAVLVLTNGVVVATYGDSGSHGLMVEDSGQIMAIGTPTAPCRLVRYNVVQEEAADTWSSSSAGPSLRTSASSTNASVRFRFTGWSVPAEGQHWVAGAAEIPPLTFMDCQFHGGQLGSDGAGLVFTNCLFERVDANLTNAVSGDYRNNTVFGGSLWVNDASFGDNLFDTTNLVQTGTVTASYNAYISAEDAHRWTPTNANDLILEDDPAYESGPLGAFYYATNGVLTNMVDAGSSSDAGSVGLYHHTTDPGQEREGNSALDIGFHYVAVSLADNEPLDSDGDGTPDYLEDIDGDGTVDSGETDPNSPDVWRLKVLITRPREGTVIP